MTENKADQKPQDEPADEKDVDGHNMWMDPTISSEMARNRSKDVEQAARDRNRAKEAKSR